MAEKKAKIEATTEPVRSMSVGNPDSTGNAPQDFRWTRGDYDPDSDPRFIPDASDLSDASEYLVLSESYAVECTVKTMGEERHYKTTIPAGVRYEVVEFSDVEVDPYANTILRTTLARIAGEIKRV